MMQYYNALVREQKQYFNSGHTRSVAARIEMLNTLRMSIQKYEADIIEALKDDLNKSEFEAYASEIGIILREIRFVIKHLRQWTKPKKMTTPLTHLGSKSKIYYEPYGTVLIIAPWNFPFQLAIAPLIGAIAAGNCAIIKPSEHAPRTSELIAQLMSESFPQEAIAVIQGGVETSQALLQSKVDYIFFTGSERVGKIVMETAAKQLTPVTLELGGKSPCIVHHDANLKLAAKRIAWGKFLNAGQTCIAPDHIYIHHSVKAQFIDYIKESIREMYGAHPLSNADYCRIVNEQHYNRLIGYLKEGEIAIGGQGVRDKLLIEPTVVTKVSSDCAIMQEEIFGPILPVIMYSDIHSVVEEIQSRPKPLALYLFTESKSLQDDMLARLSFGGGCINDTIYHVTSPYLPFGGVGNSGMGAYHGQSSFELFSHHKSVLKQTTAFDLPFRYPHARNALKTLKRFLR